MTNQNAHRDSETQPLSVKFGRRFDLIITLTILITAILFIYMLMDLPERATFFPWFITISIVLVAAIYLTSKYRNPSRWDEQYLPDDENPSDQDLGPAYLIAYGRSILRILLIFLGLVITTLALGQTYAVPLFVVIMLWVGKENKLVAIASGLLFYIIIRFVFGDMMSINLPVGYVIDWLDQLRS